MTQSACSLPRFHNLAHHHAFLRGLTLSQHSIRSISARRRASNSTKQSGIQYKWCLDILDEMRSGIKAGGRKLPKTWASTHGANPRNGTFRKTTTSTRGKSQYNTFEWKKTAAQVERQAKQQELEQGFEVYTYKLPAGPPLIQGASFLHPLCKASSSSHTLDQPLQPYGTSTRDRAARLKVPALAYTADYNEAIDLLSCLGPGPMGLDLEWNFTRAGSRRTALLQICSPSLILIIHLSAMSHRIPPLLRSILEDPNIIKTGVAIKNDALKLQRDYAIDTRNVVELSNMVKLAQPKLWKDRAYLISLRDLTRVYLGRRLRKDSVRVSDWERYPLDADQIEYAASDTFASLEVLRAAAEYFRPSGQSGAGGGQQKRLLDQVDEIAQDRADAVLDLEMALKLSAYDLYQERVGAGSSEKQKRQDVRTALREIRSNAQSRTAPSTPASTAKTKPKPATKPYSSSKVTSSDQDNKPDSSDDDFIAVTSVVRAPERALNRWLYSHRTITQVAESSNVKPSTVALYLLKALLAAIRITDKPSILDDVTPADKARLKDELKPFRRQTQAISGHYWTLAKIWGWEKDGGSSSSGSGSEGDKPTSGGLARRSAPVGEAVKTAASTTKVSTRTKAGAEYWSREPVVIEISDDEVDVQDTSR